MTIKDNYWKFLDLHLDLTIKIRKTIQKQIS